MARRPPEQVLDGILQQKGKGVPMRRKLAANRDRNWLLALTLHSFAKVANGGQLTDLEQAIVTAYRNNGFTKEQIARQGRLAESIPDPVRAELFPDKFARLRTGKDAYSLANLKSDATGITRSFLAMPNVANVDVTAVHGGRAALAEFRPDPSVVRASASEALVALEPAAAATTGRFTIKAIKFRCNDRAGDSIFNPSNEPYWIFGATAGDRTKGSLSPTFDDVDSGESRNFGAPDGVIWGLNGAPQALPDGEVGTLVSLWEHDEGDPKEIQAGVTAAFAAAAAVLTATGVAAWVGAVVAGVGAVVHWLLGFMDDDHIADQVFTVSGPVIQKQVPRVGGFTDIVKTFADGDADYTITIRVTRVA